MAMMKIKLLFLALLFTAIVPVFAQQDSAYNQLLATNKKHQAELRYLYLNAKNEHQKDSIIAAAQYYIYKIIVNEYFKNWYGTPWSFYGQTKVPKQGSIACGYFVTTILYQVGFNIPYTDWAKLASEVFIKKFSQEIKRYRNEPIENIKQYILSKSNGLYIVGLDCHVGFIFKHNQTLKFIHSSYYKPDIGVLSENLEGHNPLDNSSYVVIGKILDKPAIIKWLLGTKFN